MFIAHAPAGYLLGRLHPKLHRFMVWLLIGSVLPDLDMLAFHLVDHGTVHHHSYLSHRPAFWAALTLLALLVRAPRVICVGLGGLLHMVLDTVTGAIAWGWPLTPIAMAAVDVPATQDWWVLSFVLHWTFAVELGICAIAYVVWRKV